MSYTLSTDSKLYLRKINKDLYINNNPEYGLLDIIDELNKLYDQIGHFADKDFRRMIIRLNELRQSYEFIYNKIKWEFFVKFDTDSYTENSKFKYYNLKNKKYSEMLDFIDFLRSEFEDKYPKEFKGYLDFHELSKELGFSNLQPTLE